MLQKSNAKAYAVLSILIDQWEEEDTFTVRGYENGREHGFAVVYRGKEIAVAENRNSDEIVVYFDQKAEFFKCNEYLKAAEFCKAWLTLIPTTINKHTPWKIVIDACELDLADFLFIPPRPKGFEIIIKEMDKASFAVKAKLEEWMTTQQEIQRRFFNP